MKGCLKLTSMPSRGLDSQGHHLNSPNEHSNGAQCCHIPPTASSASATTDASCVANNASATPVRTQMHRKCVAFCAQGSETVYTADEWDRTPTEPARKLSYQDLLELKEIQRSLPHANQPPDLVTGRPGKQFLSAVPIVLLPLLSSGAGPRGEDSTSGAQAGEAKKQCYFSDTHGRTNGHVNGHTNGNGVGWGPPSLTRQAQAQACRPSFPFPPRPVPLSTPASTPAPPTSPTSASSITQPWNMNFQSQTKAKSSPMSSPFPSSPTSPFPSHSSRPSTTSPPAPYPYSNFHQQPLRSPNQPQSRASWTPPPSLSHLMPAVPIKPREKPKFEFLTLLETGAGTDGSSGPAPPVTSGVENVEVTATKVGSEALLNPASKLPSGLIEIERETDPHRPHDEHDLEDQDQDHDLVSVTSSSSCPSLCTSSCPSSCSTSEVDTDLEHESEIETERRYSGHGRYGFAKGWAEGNDNYGVGKRLWPTYTNNNRSLSSSFLTPLNLDALHDEVERDKSKVVLKKKLKEKKFILVNDMEIELDDSGSESEPEVQEVSTALSGRITNTTTSATTETTTTTFQTTTTISSSKGGSPRNIMVPVPVKSTTWGSPPPPLSASLITPPTTPPSGQVSRSGNSANISNNKPRHSPTSPSSISRGRAKGIQKMEGKGSSTSQDRSGSVGNDASGGGGGGGGGGGTSPSYAVTRLSSPVKLKSKMS